MANIIGVAINAAGKFLGFVDGEGKIRKGRVRKVKNPSIRKEKKKWLKQYGRKWARQLAKTQRGYAKAKKSGKKYGWA